MLLDGLERRLVVIDVKMHGVMRDLQVERRAGSVAVVNEFESPGR